MADGTGENLPRRSHIVSKCSERSSPLPKPPISCVAIKGPAPADFLGANARGRWLLGCLCWREAMKRQLPSSTSLTASSHFSTRVSLAGFLLCVCACPAATSSLLHAFRGRSRKKEDAHNEVQSRFQLRGTDADTASCIDQAAIGFWAAGSPCRCFAFVQHKGTHARMRTQL